MNSGGRLLTAADVAQMLDVQVSTILAWVRAKKIDHIRLSRKMIRFRMETIQKFLNDANQFASQGC